MKTWAAIAVAFLAIAVAAPAFCADDGLSALLNEVDDLYRSDSSEGRMSMTVKTANFTRTLVFDTWSEGKEKSLIRIVLPLKEKGTTTLKVNRDIWNYLPNVDRTIKIPASMMGSSWMGSHFTNDDLVRESRYVDDYTCIRDGGEDRAIIGITCTPNPDSGLIWGKIVLTLGAEDHLPRRMDYFDEDMKAARTMYFEDVGDLGGRKLPRLMRLVPSDKPDEETRVEYQSLRFNPDLSPALFSLRSLRSR